MSKPTTITFQSEHIPVLMAALESYSRARMGQFKHWFEETFGWKYDWDTGSDIETFIRLRTIEQHLEKKHGKEAVKKSREIYCGGTMSSISNEGYLQCYSNFIRSYPQTDDEPFPREINASWGILQTDRVGDGQIAYEIYQTLRQYNAVTQNGGLFDHYTSTRDPLNYSGTALPEIHGFEKHKDYRLNQTESRKLSVLCQAGNYEKAWEYINKTLRPKYKIPRGESMTIRFNETPTKYMHVTGEVREGIDPTSYYLRVYKPQKEDKAEIPQEKALTESPKSV